MSINLQQYFKLGVDTTNDGVDTPALIQTYRTPTDTTSSLHNKVTIKLPKRGLLTKDSMLIVTPQLTRAPGGNETCLNVVNGILGSFKRVTLNIDSKPLVDLERPSFLETNKLYSRFTTAHLNDYHKNFLGNCFAQDVCETSSNTDADRGKELLKQQNSLVYASNQWRNRREQIKEGTSNKRYGVYLYQLGFNFLKYNSLPVYLMKDREIELVIEFDSDCRNWCWQSSGNLNAGDVKIVLDDVELVSTHVLLDEEVEAEQRGMLKQNQVEYNLIESYLIRGTTKAPAANGTNSETFRLNLQNREVHKVLTAFRKVDNTNEVNLPLAYQRAYSLGDEVINYRVNGTYVFDDDIENDALVYYLTSLYNNGNGMKVSPQAWSQTALAVAQNAGNQVCVDKLSPYKGSFHYIGQDFKTNPAVFGGGIGFKVPLDIEYEYKSPTNAEVNSEEFDALFYISASKMLRISANSVMISF